MLDSIQRTTVCTFNKWWKHQIVLKIMIWGANLWIHDSWMLHVAVVLESLSSPVCFTCYWMQRQGALSLLKQLLEGLEQPALLQFFQTHSASHCCHHLWLKLRQKINQLIPWQTEIIHFRLISPKNKSEYWQAISCQYSFIVQDCFGQVMLEPEGE